MIIQWGKKSLEGFSHVLLDCDGVVDIPWIVLAVDGTGFTGAWLRANALFLSLWVVAAEGALPLLRDMSELLRFISLVIFADPTLACIFYIIRQLRYISIFFCSSNHLSFSNSLSANSACMASVALFSLQISSYSSFYFFLYSASSSKFCWNSEFKLLLSWLSVVLITLDESITMVVNACSTMS